MREPSRPRVSQAEEGPTKHDVNEAEWPYEAFSFCVSRFLILFLPVIKLCVLYPAEREGVIGPLVLCTPRRFVVVYP